MFSIMYLSIVLFVLSIESSNGILSTKPRDLLDYMKNQKCGTNHDYLLSAYYKCLRPFEIGKQSPNISNRIHGGKPWPRKNSFKWFVKINLAKYKNKPLSYCSGTIIGDRWVITASHCLENTAKFIEEKQYELVTLETQGRLRDDAITYHIEKVFHAPNRVARLETARAGLQFKNDVALIKTKEVMKSPFVNKLCVVNYQYPTKFPPNRPVLVIGMGNIANKSTDPFTPSDVIRYIEMENPYPCDTKICSGCYCYKTPVAWSMDSGSAAMDYCHTEDNTYYVLTALYTSHSNDQAIFTYISQFADWIYSTTNIARPA